MAKAVGTCVHCGFCLPACPTYQELESEMDSPRGRILLMKSVMEGEMTSQQAAPHIDRCLGCLACVTHCPSGVPYGDLISSYRSEFKNTRTPSSPFRDWLVRQTLPYPRRFRWAIRLGKIGRLFRWATPANLQPMLDLVPNKLPKQEPLPTITPAIGARRGRVALLAGCAQQILAPDINASAIRVLSRSGIEVLVPPNQSCCGALDWHTGHGQAATRHAERLVSSIPKDVDCFVTTAAGCGSAIHEYPLMFAGHQNQNIAEDLSKKTVDISVYLDQQELASVPPLRHPVKVAYHDACHLSHAQGVRQAPRNLLTRIPGLELAEIADCDTCCGSAGTYNIEQPDIASRLGQRKAKEVVQTGAKYLVSGNIGCLVQIEKHLQSLSMDVPVFHTVQILDRAYRELLA
jgi:glycolate oxidase iron-sulfur subunit